MFSRVGQKIVCVREVRRHLVDPRIQGNFTAPTKGAIYTIRGFVHNVPPEGYGITLTEITNPEVIYLKPDRETIDFIAEIAFVPSLFRPLSTRATDISIFTEILNKQKVDA